MITFKWPTTTTIITFSILFYQQHLQVFSIFIPFPRFSFINWVKRFSKCNTPIFSLLLPFNPLWILSVLGVQSSVELFISILVTSIPSFYTKLKVFGNTLWTGFLRTSSWIVDPFTQNAVLGLVRYAPFHNSIIYE